MIVFYVLAAYLGVGLLVAIPFVWRGVHSVVEGPVSLTLGARLILIPGAVVLWPIVLRRWLGTGMRS